jgi:ABC-type glutathione transport system ATPase component
MLLHGIDVPSNVRHDNTLARPLRDYGPKDRVDVVLTNPPFGGMEAPRARLTPRPHAEDREPVEDLPHGVRALKSVDLEIPKGMFGLLGPNGAGKSTFIRTIATLQEPDEGSITLGELDVLRDKDGVRRILGYLPQEFGVYPRVTAEALLDHFAVLKGLVRARERREVVHGLLRMTKLLFRCPRKPLADEHAG